MATVGGSRQLNSVDPKDGTGKAIPVGALKQSARFQLESGFIANGLGGDPMVAELWGGVSSIRHSAYRSC
jgi:hypothetical protein